MQYMNDMQDMICDAYACSGRKMMNKAVTWQSKASMHSPQSNAWQNKHTYSKMACLVCQVNSLFIIFLPEHAYASHIIYCISYMYCIMLLVHFPWLIVVPLLVFLFWVEPGDEFVNEEPVEYAYEDQVFDNSENLAGKMTTPSKSLLSLLCYLFVLLPCFATYQLLYHASHIAMSSL